MLAVRTRLDKSNIHGIGLFADEFIVRGMVVWLFADDFDRCFTEDEYDSFTETEREFLQTYGWKNKGKYFLSVDNERFINHQQNPNCDCVGNRIIVANVDIERGTELTIDYKQIDDDWLTYNEVVEGGT